MQRVGTAVIIGVGLIGGSIGLALRSRRLASQVIGVGRDRRLARPGGPAGCHRPRHDRPRAGVADAEVVVVCTPVNRVADDVVRAAEAAPADVLITDAGSTKRQIVEAVERHPRAAAVVRRCAPARRLRAPRRWPLPGPTCSMAASAS